MRRSNQLSYEATDVGIWSFVGSNVPVRNDLNTTTTSWESVRIYKVQEGDNKDCPNKKGLEFFLWEMGLEFDAGEIDRAHRVRRKRQDGSRAIIVKLKN